MKTSSYSKLYACVISPQAEADRELLIAVARQFSYGIEVIDDGVLFDVSGLEKLIGNSKTIAQKILAELQRQNIPGSIAVSDTVETATLLAKGKKGVEHSIEPTENFHQLPLRYLSIGTDTLNVFSDMGIRNIGDLLAVPRDELIGRYGREFENVIDVIEQKGASLLTPNLKPNQAGWKYDLDMAVEDFEQLIFVLNHGLDTLFKKVNYLGSSTEHLDLSFGLSNKTVRDYEIKTSFPTLDKAFWLKLINLRVALDPPAAAIVSIGVVSHFTRPRPDQKGLYAVSRPEPESLLLTVNKLKRMVGKENVGVPTLLDQRLAEAFELDASRLPLGKEAAEPPAENATIAFSYFCPPIRAEVLVRDGRLIFVRSQFFSGHVTEYSGVWRANSKWWDKSWKTQEWDVEIEGHGIYRLCKIDKEWFLAGEYD